MVARLSRSLQWAVGGIAALYITYLLAANALLNSSYGQSLANRQPEKFVTSWASAWSLYPGQVHANDVRIAGHTRHLVWSLQADTLRGRIALLPLLAREVRIPTLVASGTSGGATRIDAERLPPPARPGGWTIRCDEAVLEDARHAYFNDLVLQGAGRAATGFVKTLRGGPMELLPSRASFVDGTVFRDGTRLAWDTRLGVKVSIARHRREEAPGLLKLEKTDFEVDVKATTVGLRLQHRDGHTPELALTDGPGTLQGKVAWHQGSLVPGGRLRLALPAQGELDGSPESTEAVAELLVNDAGIGIKGGVAPINAGSISAAADIAIVGTSLPLRDPGSLAQRTSGHLFGRWHFDSLAWAADLVPGPKIVRFDGAGTVVVDLKIRDGSLDAGSFIELPEVAATAGALGNRFDGRANARITFEPAGHGELRPHLTASMREFRVAPRDAPGNPYVHGKDLHIDAIAAVEGKAAPDRLYARLWFANAQVPDLRAYNRYLPNSRLRFAGGAGRVSGDLQFDREGQVGRGTFQVTGTNVDLAVAELALRGDIEIDTRLRRADIKAHRFEADGSRLALKGVTVSRDGEVLASDWWSQVALDRARLDWDKPLSLDGQARINMKDVGVLLELYSQRKHLPAWVGKVVDEGEARAEGRVQWQRDTLLLEPFAASNARFEVLARMRLHDTRHAGDLYARWGALSVGVELHDGQKKLHLVRARNWFDQRPSFSAM